jgi:hypothetical protein
VDSELFDKIPDWVKSLWHMENELRTAAQQGVMLRRDEAATHVAEARRHLELALSSARGEPTPAVVAAAPVRMEGELGTVARDAPHPAPILVNPAPLTGTIP